MATATAPAYGGFVNGGYVTVPNTGSPIYIPEGYIGSGIGSYTNALLGLAALTLGMDDGAQRQEFFTRTKAVMTSYSSPEAVYEALIRIAYKIKEEAIERSNHQRGPEPS